MCRDEVVLETRLPLPLKTRGKVRDIFDLDNRDGEGRLLFVASDRI